MNGVTEDKYQLRLTQTAKGVWYVDKAGISGEDQDLLIDDMKKFATSITVLLEKLNSGEIRREDIREQ